MIIYLAGNFPRACANVVREHDLAGYKPYILQTFHAYRGFKWLWEYEKHMSLMLDSGAFTFMSATATESNWESYVDEYADFVLEHGTDLFFELDIDVVVGLGKVEALRRRLESRTGKQCIPVWHIGRGKEYFKAMCRDYPYVAMGGFVTQEYKPEWFPYLPWFIDQAHENGAKIHGLGFTKLRLLGKYRFDSVDSTTWLASGFAGKAYFFTGNGMTVKSPKKGFRGNSRVARPHAMREWIKMQKYALEFM